MFVRYDYAVGATTANILADLVALLTGTTDKATLSAACVQGTTTITNDGSRPAGWEVYDSAAGTGEVCIRALNFDGESYKYAVVNVTSTALYLKGYESWNATTHVGTNLCAYSDSISNAVNSAAGGTIFLSASARGIVGMSWVSGTYSNSPLMLMEHTRGEPWDTPALGVPPFVTAANVLSTNAALGNGYYYMFNKPRRKNGTSADGTGQTAFFAGDCGYVYSYISLTYSTPAEMVRDADYNLVHAFCPITLSNNYYANPQRPGVLYDVYMTTQNAGTMGDEVTYNAKTYFILSATNSTARLAVPKF